MNLADLQAAVALTEEGANPGVVELSAAVDAICTGAPVLIRVALAAVAWREQGDEEHEAMAALAPVWDVNDPNNPHEGPEWDAMRAAMRHRAPIAEALRAALADPLFETAP